MDKIIFYKADDGTVMQAGDFKPANRKALVRQIAEAEALVLQLHDALRELDRLSGADGQNPARAQLQGEEDGDGHVNFRAVQI